ncbi:MAG: outer membrane protein transport protein [Candidatus Aminicenantales bacterium]
MKKTILIVSVLSALSAGLQAGGWNNTLIGCRAIALGGAFCAVANDPSAIFYNPAGLVHQENRFNLALDGFYIWPTHEFTTASGNTIRSQFNTSLPQFFMTYRWSDRITLGFGMYAPYAGGGVDWKARDLGYPLKTTMGIISLTPTIAYNLSPTLSVGLNINFYRAVFTLDTEMPGIGPLKSDEEGSALSAGLGLFYRPIERLSFGLSIRGPARMKLVGKTTLSFDVYRVNLGSDTAFNLPWDIEAGICYRLSERLLVSASAQYTMWSVLDKVEKAIHDIPLNGDLRLDEDMSFRDILVLRAGAEYAFPSGLSLRAGVGLDRFASPAENLNPTNIDVDKLTLLGGLGYRTGRMTIDLAYVYGIGEERQKNVLVMGIPFSEKYNLHVQVIGLGLSFAF